MSKEFSRTYSAYLVIRAFLLLAMATILISCSGGGGDGSSSATQPVYTAIFDAGSSGTRLSFYKVIPGNGGYPAITKIKTFNDKEYGVPNDDGINDFLNGAGYIKLSTGEPLPAGCPGTSGLGQLDVEPCVIQPLLIQLDEAIALLNTANPSLNLTKSQVKVELFATAGMRTEDQSNGGSNTTTQILEYYSEMKSYVSQWGYSTGDFKTINGNSEEGLWTWTNLNDYYFNSFGGNTTVSQTVQAPVGDFEVGGSSIQIAFPINDSPSDAANIYRVSINGRTYNVFSKTFLGLGGDDARKYVKAFNYSANNGAADCYAATATVNNTKESSGIQLYPSNQVISGVYPFPSNTILTAPWFTVVKANLDLIGAPSYNYDACAPKFLTIVEQLSALQRNKYGTLSDGALATFASFKTKLQSSTAPFYGTDNFFYTAKEISYTPSTGFNSTGFRNALNTYCAGSVVDDSYKQNACPNGVFMDTYLFGSSGLFADSSAIFSGVLNPDNSDRETVLTWTRGYLLLKYAN